MDINRQSMTVREFVEKYQKHERLHGRGDEYAETVIQSSEQQFKDHGYTVISRHESVTGEAIQYGTPEWRNDPFEGSRISEALEFFSAAELW